ncbi:MAG: hypothetical protein QOF50_98 [Gaiellaceae bacterium]|jgi:hypothetical protein|nr:hypothetical protein [Gaiellaceae bacterium]
MPLDGSFTWAVSFVIGLRNDKFGNRRAVPIGTAFVLSVPGAYGLKFDYLVTAGHVVDSEDETWARFRVDTHGRVTDVAVHDWVFHPKADVAMAPLGPKQDWRYRTVPIDVALGATSYGDPQGQAFDPMLGDRVYFIGLAALGGLTLMAQRNVPMVRSGTLGATYIDNVPLGTPPNIRRIQAHLIDCRSYGGFSGSPCFVQTLAWSKVLDFTNPGVPSPAQERVDYKTQLLGIVSAHFDAWDEARVTGTIANEGTVSVPINTGIGVVTPSERILEVLAMDELADDRERREREAAEDEANQPTGATPDRVEADETYTREQFQADLKRATRRLDDESDQGRA